MTALYTLGMDISPAMDWPWYDSFMVWDDEHDRMNSRVFKQVNMQNVTNWNSRIKSLFTELEVGHLNDIKKTINEPAVMEYMHTILGYYYEQFWWETLQRK